MKRNAFESLICWNNSYHRKPIWLTGIKGAGKTYLALEFSKSYYEAAIYVNFETNAEMKALLRQEAADMNQDRNILEFLCSYFQISTELTCPILFILDEITSCPEALVAVEELSESDTKAAILLISSIPSLVPKTRYFDYLMLYPLRFDEFLCAAGAEWYVDIISSHFSNMRKVPDIVHHELTGYLDDYLAVGGMPQAVNEFFLGEEIHNVAEYHRIYLQNIKLELANQLSETDPLKIQQILTAMEPQLRKGNKKFQYRLIRKGATHGLYANAIECLVQNGYAFRSRKETFLSRNDPLTEENTSYKLYFPDVGLLHTCILMDETLPAERIKRKMLLENYAYLEFVKNGYEPCFWESASQAKIDILLRHPDGLIPVEIQSEDARRSKSITFFRANYEVPYSIQLSSKNFEDGKLIKNIPYYANYCINNINFS